MTAALAVCAPRDVDAGDAPNGERNNDRSSTVCDVRKLLIESDVERAVCGREGRSSSSSLKTRRRVGRSRRGCNRRVSDRPSGDRLDAKEWISPLPSDDVGDVDSSSSSRFSRDRDRADGKVSTRASSLLRPVSRRAVRGGSSSGNAGSWNAVSRTRAGRASGRVRGGDSVVDEVSELTELVGSNGIAADVAASESMPPSRSHQALRQQRRQSSDQLGSGARRSERGGCADPGRTPSNRAHAPSPRTSRDVLNTSR